MQSIEIENPFLNNKPTVSFRRSQGIEIADVFKEFKAWNFAHSKQESKVISSILNCRTHVLGGHKLQCNSCGVEEYSYNSCRNRHCPKCQYSAQQRWVEARKKELLPIPYFHVVFTVPHELNDLVWSHKKQGFDLLFKAVAETIKEVAATRLKAQVGFTAVLHTWSQTLGRHAHIHCIVPGGGLSFDRMKWISCKQNFFLPLKVLKRVFRGKFLDFMEKELLKIPSKEKRHQYKQALIAASQKEWVIYAKSPFAGPSQVLEYLGNYTHRIAISNSRLIKMENGTVTFKYKDRSDGNKTKEKTLTGQEFVGKFLSHVLPEKFIRIRHFGFLGSKRKEQNIKLARQLLNKKSGMEVIKEVENNGHLNNHMRDQGHCQICKVGEMREVLILKPHPILNRIKRRDSS